MRQKLITATIAIVVLAPALRVGAVCCDDTAIYIKQGYHVNKQWPWPYVCPDRIAVREPFCIMVNNGWRRENLLGAHHFNPDTNQLTSAGQLRVQWIMTQAPPDHRNIFVERAFEADINSQRMASVRDYATKVSIDGREPQIAQTTIQFEGRPAAVVDMTNTKFLQAMPAPVLPAAPAASSGSSAAQ
jgi:hypothetical protein